MIDYLARESSGQCGPCVHGLRAIADLVGELADGVAHPREAEHVRRWTAEIRGRGACHHPDGAARFVESALSVFADELVSHQQRGCAGRPPSLPVGNGAATAAGGWR